MVPPPRRLDLLLGHALALVVAVVALGPALPELGSRLLGADMVDSHGTAWFYWVVDDALRNDRPLSHTDKLFWPWGKDLYLHTGTNILDALAAVPFRRLFGATLGTNLLWLLGLGLTWAAARRLVGRVTAEPLVAPLLAALVTLSPAVLLDLGEGRPTQAILLLPVLALTALWDTARRPSWGAPVLAGLLLAASGYQYWFYGVFLGLAALGHGLAATLVAPAGQRGQVLLRHVLAAAVALLAVAPAALPLIGGAAGGAVPGLLDISEWTLRFQPLVTGEGVQVALFAWQPLHAATGWLLMHPEGGLSFVPHVRLAHSFVVAAAALGLLLAGRRRWPLLGLLLPLCLLAVGPTLAVGSLGLPNLFFIGLLEALPFLRRLWWPARALTIATIPAALALALALAWLRARHAWLGRAAAFALAALWLAEARAGFLAPVPTWDPTPPAGHRCLADGPEGAVLELPWGNSQRGLAWQSAHGRPLVGGLAEGNASLIPEQTQALLRDDGWVQRLVFLGSDRIAPQRARGRGETAGTQLSELGVAYVLLRRDELPVNPRRDESLNRLLGQPVYKDARTWIYAPWGAPYPCPHLALRPDTEGVPLYQPPRAEQGADSPAAVRLRGLGSKPPPPPRPAKPSTGRPEERVVDPRPGR